MLSQKVLNVCVCVCVLICHFRACCDTISFWKFPILVTIAISKHGKQLAHCLETLEKLADIDVRSTYSKILNFYFTE